MTKQELRAIVRQRKKQHTDEELSAFSRSIATSLLKRIEQEKDCRTILLYHSLPDEVCTHNLIRTLHATGKRVLLPTVVGDELALHIYNGEDSLSTGSAFGIQEAHGPLFTDFGAIDLAIIPGMAFTQRGDRLGRGKGYYDRLLPRLHCPLIGLAFPFQMVDEIPMEQHDVRMTDVFTC